MCYVKKILAGLLAALMAGSGAGATMTPEQEQQQADQIAKIMSKNMFRICEQK